MDRSIARESFVLRATGDAPEAHRLDDLWPLQGEKPTLWCRNNDEDTAATVKVQEASDLAGPWSDLTTVTVVKKGREKLSFTTDAKFVRFTLDADVPGGVFCELSHFHFDPVHRARV